MNETPIADLSARRAAPRFEAYVSIVCVLPATEDAPFEASLVDLSINGIAIVTPCQLARRAAILLRINGGFGRVSIECTGQVIHCRRSPGGWIAGIEFESPLTGEQIESLQALARPAFPLRNH